MQPDRWTRCDSEVYATLADHNTSTLTETPRPGSQGGSEPDPHLSSERTESHQNSNTTRTSIKDEVTGSCRWAEHISLYWLKVYYTAFLHAAHHSRVCVYIFSWCPLMDESKGGRQVLIMIHIHVCLRWRPPVAAVITTAAEEEVRRRFIKSDKQV